MGALLAPGAAWAAVPGGTPSPASHADPASGGPAQACPSCSPGQGGAGGAGDLGDQETELVLGCLIDADCGEQGLCVKEEGASADDPGDCVLSAGDADDWHADDSGTATPVEQPREQLQCSQAMAGIPEGALTIGILVGLNALAVLRWKRRHTR